MQPSCVARKGQDRQGRSGRTYEFSTLSSSQSRLSRYHCFTACQHPIMLPASGSARHRCCAALMFAISLLAWADAGRQRVCGGLHMTHAVTLTCYRSLLRQIIFCFSLSSPGVCSADRSS